MKCEASIDPFSIYLFIRLLAAVRQVFKNNIIACCCGLKLLRYTAKKRENDSMCYDNLYADYICWVKLTKLVLTLGLIALLRVAHH